MSEQLTLSQAAWNLLDMLQEQLGVTIEVLDMSMRPLAPSGSTDAPSATEEPRIAAETLKSLRTGELRIDRSTGAAVGIFPLRIARQIAGCLVVSSRGEAAGAPDTRVEGAGHLARTALESDLSFASQLADSRHRTRRAHGILRFLSQLGGPASERDMMSAVIQAATVWFDADCRIYQRQPDDSYVLAALLPGIEQRSAGSRIEKARAEKLLAARRFPSGGDLEELGLAGRREEVLVLPVGRPAAPDWLFILAGAIDQEVELTFSAIARMLAGELQARDAARTDAWQHRLARTSADDRRAPERTLLTMLEALAGEVEATSARVTMVTGESERALAALGGAASEERAEEAQVDAGEPLEYSVPVSPETVVHVSIATGTDRRRAAQEASSWVKALQPWLREVAAGLAEQASLFDAAPERSAFEQRIEEEIERAKRFNLGLGLVLIGPGPGAGDVSAEPLLAAIRSELRASDLMGRVRGGLVAVLLVHAEPVGADSVTARLQRRLGGLPAGSRVKAVQMGRAVFSAECASADALIAQALRGATRLELRN